jgi:hypothetical protein
MRISKPGNRPGAFKFGMQIQLARFWFWGRESSSLPLISRPRAPYHTIHLLKSHLAYHSSPGHPKESPSAMALLQSSMSLRLHELGKNMTPMQQNIGKALESASTKTGENAKTLQRRLTKLVIFSCSFLTPVRAFHFHRQRQPNVFSHVWLVR